MKKVLLLLTIALAVGSCKKTDEFVNPVFMCDCGSIKWGGVEYPLQMAEYVLGDPENFLSRKYVLTADVRTEFEVEPHNLNIQLGVDSVDQQLFYIPNPDVLNWFEEINQNDILLPYRTYTSTVGLVNITPAILGGNETVSFEMILREVVNSDTVGFDISMKGNFNVTINN
ncbi:MAG: hypothetical protein GC193_08510 [Cryomorphaceae bacterium]|nr:hypothetical protein [Cryomorphaceae bacterium]